ncbi:uncharacterized protein LOC110433314 [Sorghum bicolor]|uniref:Uncharacterized protein n=1 Tax=Sorghum bicolor TaxID=4558 RepID=A0A1B6Q4I3_SORBI|nr:uncharacterized protein LOC110433314 [Sorghum bicolor]KXG32837.1 hypothetical protein SORBI_3003G211600 [Sorghum bicolor]|eukprot:XP_021310827.1 uncharacterized protein LOC110433314 [Sorghum bicolor]
MSRITVMQQISILRQSGGEIMQNMNTSDTPLDIEPLTTADPGEHVVCTPRQILLHPAYHGGWKVLRSCREDGRIDLTYKHNTHGRFRSKKQVLNYLDCLLEKQKESADPAKQCSGVSQALSFQPYQQGHPSTSSSYSFGVPSLKPSSTIYPPSYYYKAPPPPHFQQQLLPQQSPSREQ